MIRLVALALFTLLILSTVSLGSENITEYWWPQFRGPNVSGVAEDGDFPVEFGPEKNLLWITPVSSGVSSPCVWGDRIFLTCFVEDKDKVKESGEDKDERQVKGKLETVCLDRTSGKILWRRDAPDQKIEDVHEVSNPANATPATDGQRVYVYFTSYGMICYDFDGNKVWDKPIPPVRIAFGNGTSPVVVDDKVILNLDEPGEWTKDDKGEWQQGASNARVLALKCDTGEEVWKTARQSNRRRYVTPVIWRHEDGDQVILFGWSRLDGYDLSTGKQLWWITDLPPNSCATPLIYGDHIYLSVTGIFGEPETFVKLPPFESFLPQHDKNQDGFLAAEEIPKEILMIDRRASDGAGNSPLRQFTRAIDKNKDKRLSQQEWNNFSNAPPELLSVKPGLYSIRLGGKGDVSKTHIDWRETKGVTEVPTPLMYDGRLYLVRNGGIVHCRGPKEGKHHFRGRLGPIGGYYASPVAGDGKIYFASDRGVITVIANGESLKVLAKNDLGERIMATPALVDGKIYVRTDRHLYAFGK
jgi:outer membrane protein assembly factor BamB